MNTQIVRSNLEHFSRQLRHTLDQDEYTSYGPALGNGEWISDWIASSLSSNVGEVTSVQARPSDNSTFKLIQEKRACFQL